MSGAILIVGAEGLIGSALLEHGRRRGLPMQATMLNPPSGSRDQNSSGASAVAALHRLDLREPLDAWQPPPDCHAAILCAAITSLEACRRDPAGTRLINVTRTLDLARKLVAARTFVVFLSSNLVFDGRQPRRMADEPTCPATEYGRQKADVEAALAQFGESAAIVRLTKVVNPQWPLLRGWAETLRTGAPVQAFADLVCAPIPLSLTVRGLVEIADRRLAGIWQFSADADVAYAEIARHLASRLGADPSLVRAVSGRAAGAVEHAPRHTTLDTTRARCELGLEFPPPLAAIDEVIG